MRRVCGIQGGRAGLQGWICGLGGEGSRSGSNGDRLRFEAVTLEESEEDNSYYWSLAYH